MIAQIISLLKEINLKLGLQKEVFNMDDFCAFTGFSKEYAYQLTSKRILRFFRPSGKQIFFDAEDVKSFLKQNPCSSKKEIELKAQKSLK